MLGTRQLTLTNLLAHPVRQQPHLLLPTDLASQPVQSYNGQSVYADFGHATKILCWFIKFDIRLTIRGYDIKCWQIQVRSTTLIN